jgi:hypothetical protein
MLLLVVGSGIFVWSGILMLPEHPFMGWVGIIFFGLCGLVGLVSLLPNSSYLTLTERGFEFASLYRKTFVHWADVDSFRMYNVQVRKMVGWNYSPGYSRAKRLRRVNTSIAGVEAGLPDTYGMSAQDLADLMNQLKDTDATTKHP